MHVKKLMFYVALFFILAFCNVYAVYSFTIKSARQKVQEHILSEIAQIDKNPNPFAANSAPLVLGAYETKVLIGDARSANLRTFFRKYNSVLYDHAESIVATSDRYGFDYRLLPAIAMQESNLCKYIPENSYNCWGWGIYGDLVTRFDSYDEGIETVGQGIKKHYIDHGLVTASAIMQKYTPSSNGSWAHGVNTFLQALE